MIVMKLNDVNMNVRNILFLLYENHYSTLLLLLLLLLYYYYIVYYYYYYYFIFNFFLVPSVLIILRVKNVKLKTDIVTCLCVKSASECDLIKPLCQNGYALKKKGRL